MGAHTNGEVRDCFMKLVRLCRIADDLPGKGAV